MTGVLNQILKGLSCYYTRRSIARGHWLVSKNIYTPSSATNKNVSIEFDGVYKNSEV
jgi:hypothetical protein